MVALSIYSQRAILASVAASRYANILGRLIQNGTLTQRHSSSRIYLDHLFCCLHYSLNFKFSLFKLTMYSLLIAPFFTVLAHAHAYARAQSQYDSVNASWVPSEVNEAVGVAIKVLASLSLLATVALFFAMGKNKHTNDSLRISPPAIEIQEAAPQEYEFGHGRSEKDGRLQMDGMGGVDVKIV
jgi:hypothetical protein